MIARYIKVYVLLLVLLAGCSPKPEFYEKVFYTGRIDRQSSFRFDFTPAHNDMYKIMLTYLTKDQQERDLVFRYIDVKDQLPKLPAIATVKIMDEKGKLIQETTSDIYRFSFSGSDDTKYQARINCQLSSLTMEKGRRYLIEIRFDHMDSYPLAEIDARLSAGIGRSPK